MAINASLNWLSDFGCRDTGVHSSSGTSPGGEFAVHAGSNAKNCLFTIDTAIKKYGVASLKVTRDDNDNDAIFDFFTDPGLGASEKQVSIGGWVYVPTGGTPSAGWVQMFGLEGSGYVAIDSDLKLEIIDSSAVSKATTANSLSLDAWYWVALKINQRGGGAGQTDYWLRFYNSAGTLIEEINTTGVSGLFSTLDIAIGVRTIIGNTFIYYLDSLLSVIGDNWPPVCPAFIDAVVPTSQGTYNQWTASAGNKWDCVSDVPDDGDGDYVYKISPGYDSYNHGASSIPVGSNVLAVGVRTMTRGTNLTLLFYGYGLMRLGTTDKLGDTYTLDSFDASGLYEGKGRVLTKTDPLGNPWTIANVDAVEIGVYGYIAMGAPEGRCSSIILFAAYGLDPFAVLTGTGVPTMTEANIVSGGKTIIITLNGGETWVAAGATFDAQRQNIINGLDSAQSEANGWDAEVKAKQGVAGVVRTSDTIVTITLDAQAAYNITATETITATIPATALTSGVALVASPTFTVTHIAPPPSYIPRHGFIHHNDSALI